MFFLLIFTGGLGNILPYSPLYCDYWSLCASGRFKISRFNFALYVPRKNKLAFFAVCWAKAQPMIGGRAVCILMSAFHSMHSHSHLIRMRLDVFDACHTGNIVHEIEPQHVPFGDILSRM